MDLCIFVNHSIFKNKLVMDTSELNSAIDIEHLVTPYGFCLQNGICVDVFSVLHLPPSSVENANVLLLMPAAVSSKRTIDGYYSTTGIKTLRSRGGYIGAKIGAKS